jgi:uncharacterized protein (DUF1778 family)
MKRSKSFRTKTLRLHPLENAIIDSALEALNGMERTQLVQEAVISEASRLGIRWTAEPAEPLKKAWRYLPDRGDEPTGVRVSVTVSLSVAELITRAAEHVHASEVMFIVGATLAHIGRLQKFFGATHADSPEEARAMKSALDKIKLPAQYQYRRRGS